MGGLGFEDGGHDVAAFAGEGGDGLVVLFGLCPFFPVVGGGVGVVSVGGLGGLEHGVFEPVVVAAAGPGGVAAA